MKHTRCIISFVLVLVMVFALCAPALADRSYEPYKYYMCVGDSIAAGCALTKDGSETYFDQTQMIIQLCIIMIISTLATTIYRFPQHTTASLQTHLTQSFCSTPAAACAPLNSGIFSKAFTTITTRPAPGATPILIPTATVSLRSPILMRLTQW